MSVYRALRGSWSLSSIPFYSIRPRKPTDRIACKVICARKSKKTKNVDYRYVEDGLMVRVFNGTIARLTHNTLQIYYKHMATGGNILCVNQLQGGGEI